MKGADEDRRPIRARSNSWAQKTASFLAAKNISPNSISIASVVFASLCAALLVWYPTPIGLIGCAITIQGRLLCNLFDGMVAIEGGKESILGPLYNEFPDRLSDSVVLVALGYSTDLIALGWFSALATALTAYVRLFGGTLGLRQDFRGPMAKQHRMVVITISCLCGVAELWITQTIYSLSIALLIVAIGSPVTCATRSWAIAKQLKQDSE